MRQICDINCTREPFWLLQKQHMAQAADHQLVCVVIVSVIMLYFTQFQLLNDEMIEMQADSDDPANLLEELFF